MTAMPSKTALVTFVKGKLETCPKWACRGLVVIFQHQTTTEQAVNQTTQHNDVGFNGVDAPFLSSLAKQYLERGTLSPKQMVHLHRKIVKYAGQILEVADKEKIVASYVKESLQAMA
jgi:hypothetical protein